MMAGVAIVNARDRSNPRRFNNTAFWGIYAVTFLVGSYLPDMANGFLVIAMALVASIGSPFVDVKQVTVISLAIATVIALAIGMWMLRPPLLAPIREARRLLDAVGWAAVLPQMLAALGALFALAGVGTVVSGITQRWIPLDHPFAVVTTYAIGMALFTMIMGNAFAAFPVMTAGIGLPLIVQRFGGDPTIMAAIGMLSGFCGTLMTPMAANFNIVPTALLELPDENAVIKVQIPTALVLLGANILLMNFLVFRH